MCVGDTTGEIYCYFVMLGTDVAIKEQTYKLISSSCTTVENQKTKRTKQPAVTVNPMSVCSGEARFDTIRMTGK